MDGSSRAQFVTLSTDQNKMFEFLVPQFLLSANFWKSNRQKIFSFSTFDFYGLIIVYT